MRFLETLARGACRFFSEVVVPTVAVCGGLIAFAALVVLLTGCGPPTLAGDICGTVGDECLIVDDAVETDAFTGSLLDDACTLLNGEPPFTAHQRALNDGKTEVGAIFEGEQSALLCVAKIAATLYKAEGGNPTALTCALGADQMFCPRNK